MTIRFKQNSDVNSLQTAFQNIYAQLASRQRSEFNWPNEKAIEAFGQHHFLLSLDSADGPQSARVKGFIGFQKMGDDTEIIVLGTDPEFRRQKIMLELFNYFVQKICKQNTKIFLEVHERNTAAMNFYLNCGFQVDGWRKNYYNDGSAAVNMSFENSCRVASK